MSTSNKHFYTHLKAIGDFSKVADFRLYKPVPGDWKVIFADIENSTEAVSEGKYKAVNVLGAAVITAVANCYENVDLPYIFGGDGAAICIPPGHTDQVKGILSYLRDLARQQFGLSLRAGIMSVESIRNDGYNLKVAKYLVSDHFEQALFSGGGISYGEKLLKEPENDQSWIISDDQAVEQADLSKLECRWENHNSKYDEIITLLVAVTVEQEPKRERIYRKVITMVNELYCENLECHPIQKDRLKLTFRMKKLMVEHKVKTFGTGWWDRVKHSATLILKQLGGMFLIYFGIHTDETDWGQYKSDLKKNSDYRKFDDCLRQVLSGTVEQRQKLVTFLEEHYRAGRLAYGISASPSVIITCLVNKHQDDHFHFVDGAEGGYAVAAEELKKRLDAIE